MARKVWNYSKFSNVNGGSDVLAKLRTFAVAQGWASTYYETNVIWDADGDGTYSFAHSGDEDHCELTSSGYGNQEFIWRGSVDPYDAQSDRLFSMMIDPAYPNVDESDSTNPIKQHDMNYSSHEWNSIPNFSFPEMLVIGDETLIVCHLRVSSTLSVCFAFGCYELLEGEYNTDNIFWWPSQNQYAGVWYNWVWDDSNRSNRFTPFSVFNYNYYIDQGFSSTAKLRPMLTLPSSDQDDPTVYWQELLTKIAVNNFSGYRNFVSIPVLRKSLTDVWVVIGHLPFYFIPWPGLVWGELIDRGNEQYIVVPTMWTHQKYGCAYRVA